jgi:superfamily I DNA/RNA helicase
MASDNRLILGGPGAGKTTRLLHEVEKELERGTPPDRLAFVSFTRAAVDEARSRAMARFNLGEDDLPHFRTLHSMAFRAIGARRDSVLARDDWKAIGDLAGLAFRGEDDDQGDGLANGDIALGMIEYARATGTPIADVFNDQAHGAVLDSDLTLPHVLRLEATIEAYKEAEGKLAFSDMLSRFSEQGKPLGVDVVIIDEAQDLTTVQWGVARVAARGAKRIIIAGDDDQAIHTWAGASLDTFLSIRAEREVLPVSYRLPREIWNVGRSIVAQIDRRFPKTWGPHSHKGSVAFVNDIEDIDFPEDTMILCRHKHQIGPVTKWLRRQGFVYRTQRWNSVDQTHVRAIVAWERMRKGIPDTDGWAEAYCSNPRPSLDLPWHKALVGIPGWVREYYRSILRQRRRLQDPPSILVSTIHGVKGGEADHVVLLTGLSARASLGMQRDADPEHRVFYVGATRARKSLTIVAAGADEEAYPLWNR